MFKVMEVSSEPSFLLQGLKGLSENQGWPIQFENVAEIDLKSAVDVILLPTLGSWSVVGQYPMHTSAVKQLQACDVIHKEQGRWVPRLLESEVYKRLVVSHAGDLDFRYAAYILGRSECARVAASFCAQSGYRHVVIVVEEEDDANESLKVLRRLYLGVEFEELLASQLVLRGTLGSLIINAENLSEHLPLLEDISYFNFMSEGGFVLDAEVVGGDRTLFFEAQKAGLRASSGHHRVYYFAQQLLALLGVSSNLTEDQALELLRTLI